MVVSNRVDPCTARSTRAGGLEVALAPIQAAPRSGSAGAGRLPPGRKVAIQRSSGGNPYITTDLTGGLSGVLQRLRQPDAVAHPALSARLAEYTSLDLTGYIRVNDHFAEQLHKVLLPDDIVWVHDYQLMPLAKALRERGHENRIGFFLHVPFPPPELITAVPNMSGSFSRSVTTIWSGFRPTTTPKTSPAISRMSAGCRTAARAPSSPVSAAVHRYVPGRRGDSGIRAAGAAQRALAVRTRGERQPGRTRHDHRRRPA